MAGSMDLRREYAQSGTHVPERRPSGQRSLHSMRIPDRQDLVVRMSCKMVFQRYRVAPQLNSPVNSEIRTVPLP